MNKWHTRIHEVLCDLFLEFYPESVKHHTYPAAHNFLFISSRRQRLKTHM